MALKTPDGITVYTRNEWGARPPRGGYSHLGALMSAVIHHGGPVGRPRWTKMAASKTCRDWQAYHMGQGWTDIGYHYLIDARGRLYQGRPTWALGAHVLGENTNRVGINFMQDGRYYGLTRAQKKTLRKLFARSHKKRIGLPALKDLMNHPGGRFGVFGHREVPGQATECPGSKILADLHKIMREF